MNRLVAAVAVSSLALSGAAAADAAPKKPSPRAKVFHASLASAGGSAYSAVSGKAQMVDNKRSDSVKLQIHGLLQPGETYSWVVYKVNGDKPACETGSAGQAVEAFRYKPLKVNAAGNASSTAKSKSFVSFSTTRYAVAVRRDSDDMFMACGEFKRKAAAGKPVKKPGKKPKA